MLTPVEDTFDYSGPLAAPWVDLSSHRWDDLTAVLGRAPNYSEVGRDSWPLVARTGGGPRELRVHPKAYSPVAVAGGRVQCRPTSTSTWYIKERPRHSVTGEYFYYKVGHYGAYRDLDPAGVLDLGGTDGLEIGIEWVMDQALETWHQVSPTVYVDPDATPFDMGLMPISDMGVSQGTTRAWYAQNLFRNPESALFDVRYYHRLEYGTGVLHRVGSRPPIDGWGRHFALQTSFPATNKIVVRLHNGNVAAYVNGVPVFGFVDDMQIGPAETPVPPQMLGRTKFGFNINAISVDPVHFPTMPDVPAQITRWWAAPFDGNFSVPPPP